MLEWKLPFLLSHLSRSSGPCCSVLTQGRGHKRCHSTQCEHTKIEAAAPSGHSSSSRQRLNEEKGSFHTGWDPSPDYHSAVRAAWRSMAGSLIGCLLCTSVVQRYFVETEKLSKSEWRQSKDLELQGSWSGSCSKPREAKVHADGTYDA